VTYGPPEYPRATSSPTIILLVAGMTGALGFLFGFFTGLGTAGTATPAPRVTVTVEEEAPSTAPEPSVTSAPPQTGRPTTGEPTSAPPASGQPGGTGDGPPEGLGSLRTRVVGTDIQPGTYRTTGPLTAGGTCYWARMKTAAGGLGDVIAADMPTGPTTVTILATDKSFQTAGCAEWTPATSP